MQISITIILLFNFEKNSPQFLLFTLFCFRETNGEKTLKVTSINFVYMRLPNLRRIARIAVVLCTREAKFEAAQRHYIKIYQSNFLLLYKMYPPLTYVKIEVKKC